MCLYYSTGSSRTQTYTYEKRERVAVDRQEDLHVPPWCSRRAQIKIWSRDCSRDCSIDASANRQPAWHWYRRARCVSSVAKGYILQHWRLAMLWPYELATPPTLQANLSGHTADTAQRSVWTRRRMLPPELQLHQAGQSKARQRTA